MILTTLFWLAVSEPYTFEIDPGFSIEVTSGVHLNDRSDENAFPFGARISYLNASETDAFLAPEISGNYEWVPDNGTGPNRRYSFQIGLMLYETYNPFAFRAGIGTGAESRSSDWASIASARGGLGYFLNPDIGIWIDIAQRWVFRSPWSFPLSMELGLQFVF